MGLPVIIWQMEKGRDRSTMVSEPQNSFGIRDNHMRGKVADFLVEKINAGSHLSVVSAYFTIYAYEALSAELDSIGHLNFRY